MSIVLKIEHSTIYRYANPVTFGEHRLIYRPRSGHDVRVLESVLEVTPAAPIRWISDVFDNSVAIVTPQQASNTLRFDVHLTIEHFAVPDQNLPPAAHAQNYPFAYTGQERIDLGAMLVPQHGDPDGAVQAFANRFIVANGLTDTRNLLRNMTADIRANFRYIGRDTQGTQAPTETLARHTGTCRDFALLMIEAVRRLGMAARFVSGYLYDPSLDGGPSGTVGAGATHAWLQVYVPGAGWIPFDPTNSLFGGPDLVCVAITRDASQATPVAGAWFGKPTDYLGMEVEVRVQLIPAPARSTGAPVAVIAAPGTAPMQTPSQTQQQVPPPVQQQPPLQSSLQPPPDRVDADGQPEVATQGGTM